MKVAIIHYWLVTMRGGEQVLEGLLDLFPQADLFTHVLDKAKVSPAIAERPIQTTLINRLPLARRHYQKYLPLMPLALERLDLRPYDLVISSESGPAKGVLTRPETLHVCYCHTPMRYCWDLFHDYRESAGRLTRLVMEPALHFLRMWDLASSARVDRFVANSHNVARRIAKHYRRSAEVVHPPVDTAAFTPGNGHEGFYLFVGQLIPYKRPDLAVEACLQSGRRLTVVGEGPMLEGLRSRAGGRVTFLNRQSPADLASLYAGCRALIFPGEEDFGIVPVEAMASGRPVIAYGRGGALETVLEGKTGLFFPDPNQAALVEALDRFEAQEKVFNPRDIAAHAGSFDAGVFKRRMKGFVDAALEEHRRTGPPVFS